MKLFARWHSPSVFTLVALCFVLPFATVTLAGCENPTVGNTSFTGIQLVTRTVPLATPACDGSCAGPRALAAITSEVEKNGATTAEVAFGAAIVGIVLGLLGVVGAGWCAAVGIGALLQFAVFWPDDYEVSLHVGYGLALLLFGWAGVFHWARWWKRRPPRPARSFGHRAAVAVGVLVLIPLSMYVGVKAGGLWITPLFWAAGLYVYRSPRRADAAPEPPPGSADRPAS